VLRFTLQSAVLGLGAYLVIQQQATAGIIIASSIIVARALAPVELAIANWRGLSRRARAGGGSPTSSPRWTRGEEPMALPAPKNNLVVENVVGTPPGIQRVVVQDINFTLKAGQGLGVIGPERVGQVFARRVYCRRLAGGARQSALTDGAGAGSMVVGGAWAAHRHTCLRTWSCSPGRWRRTSRASEPEAPLGRDHRGQPVAGVHDMIVRLPEGYDTQIGESGAGAFGRTAPADRARRARSMAIRSCRYGRAELESRLRWRQGA
jgi:ATP-binding cassette subfamily C protein